MARKKTPAQVVIEAFGIRPLAAELGCSPTTVYRWGQRADGLVPIEWHRPILDLARRERKPDITAEVLTYGR